MRKVISTNIENIPFNLIWLKSICKALASSRKHGNYIQWNKHRAKKSCIKKQNMSNKKLLWVLISISGGSCRVRIDWFLSKNKYVYKITTLKIRSNKS